MKIISIGDIHGRNFWKEIDPAKYDLIVFVGDYVDSYFLTDTEILNNFLEIIEFKKLYPDKVVLILGNHDIGYMFRNEGYGCDGERPSMVSTLYHIFTHNKKLFQVAHQIDNYVWTHAGISNVWYKYNKDEIERIEYKFNTINLADTLNHMLLLKENNLLHQIGRARGGYHPSGGITWADRKETSVDYFDGIHQIVGHTPIQEITKYGDQHGSIRYIDVLGRVAFLKEEYEKEDKKWGKNNKSDETIRQLFPELKPNKTEQIQITKFYEFEIEHSVQ